MNNSLRNLVGLPTVASSMSVFNKTIANLDKVAARNMKRHDSNTAAIDALHAENKAVADEAFNADVLSRKLRSLMS